MLAGFDDVRRWSLFVADRKAAALARRNNFRHRQQIGAFLECETKKMKIGGKQSLG
jgi:hypothetical protein